MPVGEHKSVEMASIFLTLLILKPYPRDLACPPLSGSGRRKDVAGTGDWGGKTSLTTPISDFLTSQENALAHFQIVARASCPCYLEIFHGRDAHATKGPRKNNFTFWTQMHPARLRCENSKYREYSCVFAPCRAGAYTPNSVNLFLRGP
jgi:hypothetical protein